MSLIRNYVHAVWAVKYRDSLVDREWKDALNEFIEGALVSRGHVPLACDAMPDHYHALFRFSCREDIALTMQHIKGESSNWISLECLNGGDYAWQQGYGLFSVSATAVPQVKRYIWNQERILAARLGFHDEYRDFVQQANLLDDDKVHWFDPFVDR